MPRHVDRSEFYRERASKARQLLDEVKAPEARQRLISLAAQYEQTANGSDAVRPDAAI